MDTDSLKKIIENKIKYKYLYEVFDKYHEKPLETVDWHDGMIREATGEYKAWIHDKRTAYIIIDEKIEMQKQDFYEMMYLMEKILYIAERSGAREDSDNNAYSLAITFGKENVVQELLSLRRKMNRYLDEQGEAELEKVLESIDDITIPYGLTLETLRKELEPYFPKRIEG